MSSPKPEIIAYAKGRRRNQRRALFGLLTTAAVLLVGSDRRYRWHGPLLQRAGDLYWQWRVVHERVPSGTIAVNVPVAFRAGEIVGGRYRGDCGGTPSAAWAHFAARLRPAYMQWLSRSSGIGDPDTYVGPGPTLFVGRLSSPAGNRIVHVSLNAAFDRPGNHESYVLAVTVVAPATVTQPAMVAGLDFDWLTDGQNADGRLGAPVDWTSADFVIKTVDRGHVDRVDSARFTCDFTTCFDRRHLIEGTLLPHGDRIRLRFTDAPGPAATAGSGSAVIAGP